MKCMHTVMTTTLAMLVSGMSVAAVTPEEAAQLGDTLTAVGAEKAGNADGSIPAYSGGLTTPPADFTPGESMRPNPYASEEPVLVIDAGNLEQYKGQLTATTAALLQRYPSYRLDVYQTHRSAALPQAVLDNTLKNATQAQSTEGGMAVENALPGFPFPIPQSGAEAMWNFLLRYQGDNMASKYDSWNVDSAGTPILSVTGQSYINYPVYEKMDKVIDAKDIYFQMKLQYSAPARRAGEAIMLRDAANPLVQPRRAWQYLPGQRRVKLAPSLDYDTPNPGTGGAGTYDDVYVFNGAINRYEWSLVGKQEMYVPYNAYDVTYQTDVKQLLTPNHLSPDFVRWEKHRVWVVEANLKEGARHVYHKRRFYLDEDSWVILASDQYDARGQLYRGSYAFLTQSYDKQVPDATPFMIYDLTVGSYNINALVGPYGGVRYSKPLPSVQWAPDSLAGAGIR